MKIEHAIIVTRKTRLEQLQQRFNTQQQARFYVEHSGQNFSEYQTEHDDYSRSLETIQQNLQGVIKTKVIDRSFVPSYIFAENDMILVVGQDGLVANTAKYANQIPIIAINPDPKRFDGILLPFDATNFHHSLENVLHGQYPFKLVTMAEVKLNDGQRLLAFNDFFIGPRSHVSARYKIMFSGRTEIHSSSGIIISTGAGSTGWLSSLFNMANGINRTFIGSDSRSLSKLSAVSRSGTPTGLPWDSEKLVFVVREPFFSKMSQVDLTGGYINADQPLILESHMPDYGVIFSDGVEADFLNFNSGAVATVRIAEEKAKLVMKS